MENRTARALLELCRPANVLLSLPAVVLGGFCAVPGLASDPGLVARLVLAAVTTGLSLAAGNVLNDLADQAEDAVNRPERPLPSRRVSRRAASRLSHGLVLLALVCSLGLSLFARSLWPTILAATCMASLVVYDARGKQWLLTGNLLVAGLAGMAVLYGAVAVALPSGPGPVALGLAGFAVVVNALREIIKDAEDLPGDLRAGRLTLPMRFAPARLKQALLLAGLLLPAGALWLGLQPGLARLGLAVVLVPVPLALRALWSWQPGEPASSGRTQSRLKLVMLAGLLVYALQLAGLFV